MNKQDKALISLWIDREQFNAEHAPYHGTRRQHRHRRDLLRELLLALESRNSTDVLPEEVVDDLNAPLERFVDDLR